MFLGLLLSFSFQMYNYDFFFLFLIQYLICYHSCAWIVSWK